MKNRPRGGLGRGLGALIPTAPPSSAAVVTEEAPEAAAPPVEPAGRAPTLAPPTQFTAPPEPKRHHHTDDNGLAPVPGARFAELLVSSIEPNAKQPRHVFDEEALE